MGVCTCSVFRNAYLKEGKTVAVQLFSGQEWVSAVAVKRFQEHAGCRCSQNVCQCYSYRPHIQVSLLVLTDATSQTYHCLPVEKLCSQFHGYGTKITLVYAYHVFENAITEDSSIYKKKNCTKSAFCMQMLPTLPLAALIWTI